MINSIAKYKVFSNIDLRSAYYQVPLAEEDRPFTAFEADGKLWQYTRVPFRPTNRVPCFQREMDNFVAKYELNDISPYICGDNQEEHDINLKAFREAASKTNLRLNEEKCIFSVEEIDLLGYRISRNSFKPDSNCLEPLLNLTAPTTPKELKRVVDMFSYYTKWVNQFSDKIRVLNSVGTFPLNQDQLNTFQSLKQEFAGAAMQEIDENIPFIVETDALDFAISATLN